MKKTLLLLLTTLLFITGCAPKEKIVYVTKVKTKYILMPKDFYKDDINMPNFPSMKTYIKASPYKREKILTNHILDLYNCIGKYKLKLKSIKEFNEKMNNNKTTQENH